MRKFFIALLLVSCAGTSSNQPVATQAEEAVVGPHQVAWKDMSKEQRGKYMKAVVMPEMAAAFSAFSTKEFPDPSCATCHGENAKDKGFAMPNPDILKLPATMEGFEKLGQEHPRGMKFMTDQVKPMMAKLLDLPNFNPEDPQPGAFSCGSCHTFEEEVAQAAP